MQENENYELDPNFAVVCSFLERFGKCFGDDYAYLKIKDLKDFLEASEVDANEPFIRLHLKLCRGIGEKCSSQEWQKAIIKFCKDFPDGDNLLIKEKGYVNIPISAKLRILKNLCEDQFEYNDHFNRLVNQQVDEGTNLRHEPVGKDRFGRSYWFMLDKSGGLRLFRRWWNGFVEDESWNIVSSDVSELERLIEVLEENEDVKLEDLPVQKCFDVSSDRAVTPTRDLCTGADDAANMVYFSSIKNSPLFCKRPVRRTKSQILRDERKHKLRHCDVRIQRLSEKHLNTYRKHHSPPPIQDHLSGNETAVNTPENKPSQEDNKSEVNHSNITSNIVESSTLDKGNCDGSENDTSVKEKPCSDKTKDKKCLKTCNQVSENIDVNREANDLNKDQLNDNEKDTTENKAGDAENKFIPLMNCKGDACSQQENIADIKEESETCMKTSTVYQTDSEKQIAEYDNDKNIFDNAIQDLLLLDCNRVKSEKLKVTEALLNGTKGENDVTNEKQTCFNEPKADDKQEEKGLYGVDSDPCLDADQRDVDNALKDLMKLESLVSSNDLNLSNKDGNKTMSVSSEDKEPVSLVVKNSTKLDAADDKSSAISCDETFSCRNAETNNKEKKIDLDSLNNDRNAESLNKHTNTCTFNKEQNMKEVCTKKDEKKSVSIIVGEEIIQIEEASTNSDEESEVNIGKITGTQTNQETVKNSKVFKEDSNNEKSGKVLNEHNSKPSGNIKNLCYDTSLAKPDIKLLVMDSKRGKESVKPVVLSAINTSGQNAVFLPVGSDSQKKIRVNGTAEIPAGNFQTKVSSVANITTFLVPLMTKCSLPSVMLNTSSSNQPQSQTLKSLLTHQVVSSPSGSNPLIGNPSGVRMILQNKVISGPISFPCVASTAPTIIYAPTLLYKPTPVSVPVVTSQKQSSILSSHIVQGQQSSNMYTHVTNCGKILENLIKAPIVGNSGGNIPKVVHESGVRANEPSVSVQNVTIVVGKDGVHYDKSTGKPYKYPNKKKYVVAGPKGKFYDKATGYEVDVPQSENLKHVPGTVYLASEVSFTKEVQELLKKKRKKEGTSKKCKKSKNVSKELTSSDEEFAKMLETEMAKTSEEESDDIDYDYEKISQRVRMARSKKLPVRQQYGTMDIEDQESEESDSEMVPLVLGRNAKRAAAKKLTDYTADIIISSDEEETYNDDSSETCTVCSNKDNPSIVLLCDECKDGYHMSCLLPPLFLVPLEDWFCPQCEHGMLIESLKEKLKVVRRAERSNKNKRAADRISQKTFSIDTENIVEIERRSCRQRKEVSYSDASYDKKFKEVFKEINMTEKKTRGAYSSESDTDLSAKGKEGKAKKKQSDKKKRHSDRLDKSRQLKKSKLSGQNKTKRRKLTSLEDESEESGSDYVDADDSGSSDNVDGPVDKSEDQPVNEIAFTSSGRQIKNVCYKIT